MSQRDGASAQMPVHNETNGIGAQMPTEKYGVRSPFHAGGGGGGGGGNGAAMQVLDGGSNTVPAPHSVALLTPGEITVIKASAVMAAAPMLIKRLIMAATAALPGLPQPPHILRRWDALGQRFRAIHRPPKR